MNYAEQMIGVPLRDLKYYDIKNYFREARTESDLIEFKSFSIRTKVEDNWKGIFKAVCAFLNSSGGLIIWGAPEGEKHEGKKEKIFMGTLTGLDSTLEKDLIVSKISSNLVPLVSGFRVEILDDGTGNRVCIIELDASNYAPHQMNGFYYMRQDGQSVLAPHHYIEALFKRVSYPNLEGYLRFGPIHVQRLVGNRVKYSFTVFIYIYNFSPVQNEKDIFFKLTSDNARCLGYIYNSSINPRMGGDGRSVYAQNVESVLSYGHTYKYHQDMVVDSETDDLKDGIVAFSLQFGGKYSPSKTSKYKIDFLSYQKHQNENDTIIEKNENVFTHASDLDNGLTKESLLKRDLGR